MTIGEGHRGGAPVGGGEDETGRDRFVIGEARRYRSRLRHATGSSRHYAPTGESAPQRRRVHALEVPPGDPAECVELIVVPPRGGCAADVPVRPVVGDDE